MKLIHVFMAVVTAVALAAGCGGTSAQLKMANAARYQGSEEDMFKQIWAATEASYKIADGDPARKVLVTAPQWFTEEGATRSEGEGGHVQLTDRAINLRLEVELKADEQNPDYSRVVITPIMQRFHAGQSALEDVKPDDGSVPGFIEGKVEALAVAIHDRLKSFELATGAAPTAATPTTPTTPTTPAPQPGPSPTPTP